MISDWRHPLPDGQAALSHVSSLHARAVEITSTAMARRQVLGIGPDRNVDSDDEGPSLEPGEAEELADIIEKSRTCITTHLMPCMGLGTGHSNLDNKLHAWLYACHLENEDWESVQAFCNSITSFTTDWGTESGLAGAPRIDFDECFPFWSRRPFFDEDDLGDGGYFDEDVLAAELNVIDGQPHGVSFGEVRRENASIKFLRGCMPVQGT
jgi:hypothetical protein